MSATNIAFLSASVLLQLVLLASLFSRRMTSQLRLFPVIVGFYLVRSVLLVVLFPWVSSGSYVQIYTVLSAVDVLLQISITIEISLLIVRVGDGPYHSRALIIPAIFVSAAMLAYGIFAALPARSKAPADRAGIFTGLLFLGLLVWSFRVRLTGWQRSVLSGLAGLGAAGIVTQLGRSFAAVHQNAHAYRLWSYCNAVVYLIALVFWIVSCRPVAKFLAASEARVDIAEDDDMGESRTLRPQSSLQGRSLGRSDLTRG